MRKNITQLLIILFSTLLYNFLFWEEKMGLNTLLFAVFYIGILVWLFPGSRRRTGFMITAGGTLLAASMVVWHNSGAAKFTFWFQECAAGFAQEPELRQILYAMIQYLTGWLQVPRHFFESLRKENAAPSKAAGVRKTIGLSIVPLMVVAVFYVLYYLANDKFAALADSFWAEIGRILSFDFNWEHFFFVLFAFFMIGAALWRNQTFLLATDAKETDDLVRGVRKRRSYPAIWPLLGLKREYQQAGILLWMLNALLLIVNFTDLRYVWFGFDENAMNDLKGYVHEGTFYLIASILLAIGVLFYVFRKNLNFYPGNKPLLLAAGIWLAQNALLAISVGVRNSRYIDYHGLAYKRIGVFLFLLLVFFGLITLYKKIKSHKTMSWLWRQNSWAFYALMLFNACIAWDQFITRYNVSGRPKGAIDVNYMIYTLSDKNISILENNLEALKGKTMYPHMEANDVEIGIRQKRQGFESEMTRYTWKSWNMGDLGNARQ